MSRAVLIRDRRGERTLAQADLPLKISSEPAADLYVAGAPAQRAAGWIGLADQHLFVQPAADDVPVYVNDRRLRDSRWIADGDVIRVGRGRIRCTLDDQRLSLQVETVQETPELRPPSHPPRPSPQAGDSASEADPPVSLARRRTRGPSSRLTRLFAGLFALLVLVAGFVFLAAPVSLNVDPAPDELDISGWFPSVELGGRRLMLPGDYSVRAVKAGYREGVQDFTVQRGAHREVTLILEKLPGRVSVTSRPVAGAQVRVDGKPVGRTPLEDLELAAGPHLIALSADRYLGEEISLQVQGLGQEQSLVVDLTPGWAPVSFSSEPPGAGLVVDGEPVGVTPVTVDLDAGTRVAELRKPAYQPARLEIQVVANAPLAVPSVKLAQAHGVLSLASSPAGATVSVDGVFAGTTPLELSLKPRETHQLKLVKPGYRDTAKAVSLAPEETRAMTLRLAARTGVVFITSSPADAELLVDGRSMGAATRRLELIALPHSLEIRKKGYAPFKTTLSPRPGVSQRLDVALKTVLEAAEQAPVTGEGQALVLVKPARFQMGASRREAGRRGNESVRLVQITRAYYLAVKEVTNREFRRFKRSHGSGSLQGNRLDAAEQPVVNVSWEDAARYLNWLSRKDGLVPAYWEDGDRVTAIRPPTNGYRLPTEAEWAYAARYAGATAARRYPWGQGFPPTGRAGNFADESASGLLPNVIGGYKDGFPASASVGSFSANPLGVFDLGGNVAEWCHDFYGVYPGVANRLVTDPLGPETGKHHVVRGSSWRHASITELRFSFRDYSMKFRDDLGFRIARYVE